jgi:hypothetical protein
LHTKNYHHFLISGTVAESFFSFSLIKGLKFVEGKMNKVCGIQHVLVFDETARDLKRKKRRLTLKTGIESIDCLHEFQEGLTFPTVLDIVGPTGSGKTEILLNLCVHSTCPSHHSNNFLEGSQGSIMYICMGQAASECLPRLITLFDLRARRSWGNTRAEKNQIPDLRQPPPESWIESFVLDCLSRVHFVHCSNSLELLASAHCAETLITSEPSISGILIDNLSSYQALTF